MALSKGKEFEKIIFDSTTSLFPKVDITRLYDTTNGYKTIHNPSDFIAYCYPTHYYIECKSRQGNTLSISEITQLEDLKTKSKVYGNLAGVILWYIKHKRVFWVDIRYIEELEKSGAKSININEIDLQSKYIYEIPSKTPRVYPQMFMEEFFNNVKLGD